MTKEIGFNYIYHKVVLLNYSIFKRTVWKLEVVKFLWKRKPFDEAGSRSKLGSIWFFEEPKVEAFFKKSWGMGCGSGGRL